MKTKETRIPVKLFISATPNICYDPEYKGSEPFTYEVHTFDLTGLDHRPDDILLFSENISITLPEGIDLIQKSVDTLEEQKKKLQVEYHMKKIVIEDKIANLLALEYKPDQESQ